MKLCRQKAARVAPLHTMTYRWKEVNNHVFQTLELDGGEWSASLSGHFATEREIPLPVDVGDEVGRAPEPV